MKRTILKVLLQGPGRTRAEWTGYFEDPTIMVQSRGKLETQALTETTRDHGEGWSVKSVSITFPPLNPQPKSRRAKG